MSYNTDLQGNNAELQEILDAVNALPEAGEGAVLPELTNPGSAEDLRAGKELIGQDGSVIVGTAVIAEANICGQAICGTVLCDYGKTLVIQALEVTENGTYTAPNGVDGYSPVTVNVPVTEPVLQSKTVTPATTQQTVTPDSGYDGLSDVVVNAMPTATQATPSITVDANGLITASATQATGYVTAGSKSATQQLPTQAGTTITPTTSEQVAVSAGTFVTGDIKVAAAETGGGESEYGYMTVNCDALADYMGLPLVINGVECIPGETTRVPNARMFNTFFLLMNDASYNVLDVTFEIEGEDTYNSIILGQKSELLCGSFESHPYDINVTVYLVLP